jgi:hypothetical protein
MGFFAFLQFRLVMSHLKQRVAPTVLNKLILLLVIIIIGFFLCESSTLQICATVLLVPSILLGHLRKSRPVTEKFDAKITLAVGSIEFCQAIFDKG